MTKQEWIDHIKQVTGIALDASITTRQRLSVGWRSAVLEHKATEPDCRACAARKATKALEPMRTKAPTLATAERWLNKGGAKATDGCRVEPDGRCEHGCPSWLLELGCI